MKRKMIRTLADWVDRVQAGEALEQALAGETARGSVELLELVETAERVLDTPVPGPTDRFRNESRIRILNRIGARYPAATKAARRAPQNSALGALRRAFFGLAAAVGILVAGIGASIPIQNTLPGDALYVGKIFLEDLQQLAASPSEDAILQSRFASNRLTEIQILIVRGRFADVDAAVQRYETNINQALAALVRVAQEDGADTYPILKQVESDLQDYAMALDELVALVPGPTQIALARAIQASQVWSGQSN